VLTGDTLTQEACAVSLLIVLLEFENLASKCTACLWLFICCINLVASIFFELEASCPTAYSPNCRGK
jgi:hypothetical protein